MSGKITTKQAIANMSLLVLRAGVVPSLLMALAGCQSTDISTRGVSNGFETISVGSNLVGEDCRAQTAVSSTGTSATGQTLEVFCGRWEYPSARIFKVVDDGTDYEKWTRESWWRSEIDRRMSCQSQQMTVILGNTEALLLSCRLSNGGWPYTALIARIDRSTYLADGIPASLPAIEGAIGVSSGLLDQASFEGRTSSSAAIQQIEATLKGRLYGTGDLRTYYKLMALGQYYNSVKDYRTAERQYREALTIQEKLLGIGNSGSADPMMHLALELSNQARFIEADALFLRVSELMKQSVDETARARYLSYRAYHAANQRRFDEALALANQATEARMLLDTSMQLPAYPGESTTATSVYERDVDVLSIGGSTPAAVDVVQSLYLEAAMRERLGEADNSENLVAAARSILYNADQAPANWEPQLLGLSGRIAESRGATGEASESFESAAALWEERFTGQRPTSIAYFELGKAYRKEGRLDDALVVFKKAVDLVRVRGGSVAIGQITPYLDTALEVATANPKRGQDLAIEMFDAAQIVHGTTTARNIALAVARLSEEDNEIGRIIRELQEAEDQRFLAEQDYQVEVVRVDEPGQQERLRAISDQIISINQQIQKLSAEVQTASPGYNQLIDSVTTVKRVGNLLGPNEALFQILLADKRSYAFLFRDRLLTAYAVNLSSEEAAVMVSSLRKAVDQSSDGTYPPFDVLMSHELYKRMFARVSDQLVGVTHLITAPTGALLSLPFGLLVTDPPPRISGQDYTRVQWLAKRTATSLVPSVRSFVDLRAIAQPSAAPKSFIGFGDFVPYSTETIARSKSALPEECRSDEKQVDKYLKRVRSLGELPYTRIEVKAVARTFPEKSAQIYLKNDFNKKILQTIPLDQYRILYFATHALLPYEIQCQSEPSLLASLPPVESGDADGFITLSDILRFRLDAELVVLSACNTGGPGLKTGGESLSGLARAFFYAGARSMLVSHWAVEDAPTAIIMISTFERLRDDKRLGIAAALRTAQLGILKASQKPGREYLSHPVYWAAFTLVGDGGRNVVKI